MVDVSGEVQKFRTLMELKASDPGKFYANFPELPEMETKFADIKDTAKIQEILTEQGVANHPEGGRFPVEIDVKVALALFSTTVSICWHCCG